MGERPYFAIFQDKAETSGDRLEWTEGICGVSHPTEEQFGRGRCSRLPVQLFLVRSTRLDTLVGMKSYWCMIRNGGGACISRRNDQR